MVELTKNEELILISIWKLKENAYGVTIRANVKAVTGKTLNYGSMYNTLYLLVRRNLVVSMESEPLSKKGGRRRVLYSLTAEGKKALARAREIQKLAWSDVPDLFVEKENE